MTLRNGQKTGVESLKHRLDETVTHAECGRCENVGNAGVRLRIVSFVMAHGSHSFAADDERQPVLVRDVLHKGADDFSTFVVEHVTVPVRINYPQLVDDTIVFSEP